jgi:hypothetical protein
MRIDASHLLARKTVPDEFLTCLPDDADPKKMGICLCRFLVFAEDVRVVGDTGQNYGVVVARRENAQIFSV